MNRRSTEESEGNENTLNDTLMVDVCHYTSIKSHRIYNPNVNWGLQFVHISIGLSTVPLSYER